MNLNFKTIDEYIDGVDGSQKEELQRIRSIAKEIAPKAEESITWGMPTLKYMRKPLIFFAAFKNHYSIFPTPGVIIKLKDRLSDYELSKGTIKIKNGEQMPKELIEEIVRERLQEIS